MTYSATPYTMHSPRTPKRRRVGYYALVVATILVLLAVAAGFTAKRYYDNNLKAVSSDSTTKTVTIAAGTSLDKIAATLQGNGLIRSQRVFMVYVKLEGAAGYLQSGTYEFSPNQTTQQIVAQLTHGKVATKLVTILPGQRIDQIRASFIQQGFSEDETDKALDPAAHATHPLLKDLPKIPNLEGLLFPDSFQRTETTKLTNIVNQSLNLMQKQLTADIRQGYAAQGLNTYQGIILASLVEQEVANQSERAQAAQVFFKRIKVGMPLGSDVAAFYGSETAGRGRDIAYDTPYNTRLHTGLPPTPVSNVTKSSLEAVAKPADTDWLYFVSGDDGITYFSKTFPEHEALIKQHCIKLCQ